jgi:hypothetical protein
MMILKLINYIVYLDLFIELVFNNLHSPFIPLKLLTSITQNHHLLSPRLSVFTKKIRYYPCLKIPNLKTVNGYKYLTINNQH